MLHLIHPALVHVTVAFLGVGGILEAVGILARSERAERSGTLLTLIGTASLLPTVAAGFLAENTIDVAASALPWLDRHERFAIILLGVVLCLLVTRAWGHGRVAASARTIYAAALLLAVALMLVTAFFGGLLVYGFGVGITPGGPAVP